MKKILVGMLLFVCNCFVMKAENGIATSLENNLAFQSDGCAAVFERIKKLAIENNVREEHLTTLLEEIASQIEKGVSLEDLSLVNKKELANDNKKMVMTILLAAGGGIILGMLLAWLIQREMPGQGQRPGQNFIFEPDTNINIAGGRVEFRGEMLLHPNAQFQIVRGTMNVE